MKLRINLKISLTYQSRDYQPMATILSMLHKQGKTNTIQYLISKYNCIDY